MKMKIELFKKAGELKRVPYESAAFDSMVKAREVAFAEGKRRDADEVAIVSVGSTLVRERWVPNGAQWKRFNSKLPWPLGRLYDPVYIARGHR